MSGESEGPKWHTVCILKCLSVDTHTHTLQDISLF